MSSQRLYILWDESQIWGLLAWRAALGLGLDFRVLRAAEVREGALESDPPAMLLVPGGTARLKAEALGREGMEALRAYVEKGGHYLGFCGGAGLGLSSPNSAPGELSRHSLGLCPWTRGAFEERMQHFMSGHLEAELANTAHPLSPCSADPHADACGHDSPPLAGAPLLPVWWPSRFMPDDNPEVTVLARYGQPGKDFWLADLPIGLLPPDAFSAWRDLYGINLSPAFLAGQPCVIHGKRGRGTYTLSYSHLETPESSFANHWLAHILRSLGGLRPERDLVPPWKPRQDEPAWEDQGMLRLLGLIRKVVSTGLEHGLLFSRNDWLFGWRTGIPGSALNSLSAAALSAASLPPSPEAGAMWREHGEDILVKAKLFTKAATHYLLAERLSQTLAKTLPGTVSPELLKAQRQTLFGPPMQAGGLYRDLMLFLDDLAFAQARDSSGAARGGAA